MRPDPMSDLILAASTWKTNAELIVDVARLGYLRTEWRTLDPAHGDGKWWTLWRPDTLVISDKYKGPEHHDFRHLPHVDGAFDAIAFDPPYVCPGGRKTSTIKPMHAAYGMNGDDFRTPAELQQIINDGLAEMCRVVRSRGVVLVKAKDYVWSGKLFPGAHYTLEHALSLGFELIDRFEHVGTPGPQSQTRQVHARRNLSTLFVLRRAARPRQETML
jgi:hypothetical protein